MDHISWCITLPSVGIYYSFIQLCAVVIKGHWILYYIYIYDDDDDDGDDDDDDVPMGILISAYD
jgi:hypothetical protein